jgi:hypothetical protein
MFTPSMYLTRTKTAVAAFAVFLPSIALGQAGIPASAMDYLKTAKMDDPRAVPTASDEALAKFPPTL